MCWYLETPALDHSDICWNPISELDLNNVSEGQLLHDDDDDHGDHSTTFEMRFRNVVFHLSLHGDLLTVPTGNSVLWDKVLESLHDLCRL